MNKKTFLIIALVFLLTLSACSFSGQNSGKTKPGSQAGALSGKKIIFVGCSYTYYGGTVRRTEYNITSQEKRANDQGYFYQLCKANGAEISVMDWCYGGHSLTDLFGGSCKATSVCIGYDHLADITDRYYDYVVLQEIKEPADWTAQQYADNVRSVMNVFREANPNVRFYYVIHDGVYANKYSQAWKDSVPLIREEGAVIVDWGTLVWDIISGKAKVPGSEMEYNKNSFIVSNSASDGYHPNLLSGYLSALMTYCAITGETAVGQPYAFCTDGTMEDVYFDMEKYVKSYYKWDDKSTAADERATSFIEIFHSEADMKGLQTLADEYLKQFLGQSAEPQN